MRWPRLLWRRVYLTNVAARARLLVDARPQGSVAAYHICPSDTQFEVEPMEKKGKVHGSAKLLIKNYYKNLLKKDFAPIDNIFAHLQFGLRLKMLEILKGENGQGDTDLVTVIPDGVTLKRTPFQPRIKAAMKRNWLESSKGKDGKPHPGAKKYEFGEALEAYHPERINNGMPGYTVLLKVWEEELWPKLSLRSEISERFQPTTTSEDSQTSLCLELHVARNFWPVVLAVQLPMWTILLLVPFAWEFLRSKEEQGFFEAYGYLAALLLTAVAHRQIVDSFTEKISGLTKFDYEFGAVLFNMMLTWIGVATAISHGHTDDGLEEDGEMEEMFREHYYGFLRTIFFVQLGLYGSYVIYQLGRLSLVDYAFKFAQPDALATRGLQDMHVNPFAYISVRKDRTWCGTKKEDKDKKYIHKEYDLLQA